MIRLTALKYLKKGGWFIPFKVRGSSCIHIGKNVSLQLGSRLVLGADTNLPLISAQVTNIYFDDYSSIEIGASVVIGPGVNLITKRSAKLKIGKNTYFTSDAHIEVTTFVEIGSDCAISWGVTIIDDHHHQLLPINESKPIIESSVIIGNHVWIGCNVTILKGSVIGDNCVIAAGSVVNGTFPDNTLIGGNPARALKTNISWK